MERRIFFVGILIMVLGAVIFLLGRHTPGTIMLMLGALDLLAVIFWPNITGAASVRREYSLGNQITDAVLIVSGVVLAAITGMPIFLALTLGGIAALSYRYENRGCQVCRE